MMHLKLFSTVPTRKDDFWQIVLFPTVTILRSSELDGPYTVISGEWLFWSITIVINDNER